MTKSGTALERRRRRRPPSARLWLERGPGECAFPVGGDGRLILSCCRPCGAATYCDEHAAAMRGPPALSIEAMELILAEFLY
jgi:hypothetical protein